MSKKSRGRNGHGTITGDLAKKNKDLGDANKHLESQLKAKEAEAKSLQQAQEELQKKVGELESREMTVVETPTAENPLSKIIDKLMEAELHQVLTKGEMAQNALSYQKQVDVQALERMQRETEIRSKSPEVISAQIEQKTKRFMHIGCFIVGALAILFCAFLCFSFLKEGFTRYLYVAAAFGSFGLLMLLIGVVSYISPQDADKVERLAKVFGIPFNALKEHSKEN